MYYVRFISNDQHANEEYFYQKECDAIYHFDLFRDDDSGLYIEVELGYVDQMTDQESALRKIIF